jgi:tRNA-Thr(GGU) m(6)t(6)A37 methyltransferase TsaA
MAKMQKFRPGCYVLVTHAGKVLVTRKTRGPFTGRYDLPGGGIEHGEAHLDTAVRELKEEIGLAVRAEDLSMVGVFEHVAEFEKNGEAISQHIIGIAYRTEVDAETFKAIASGETVGSEENSDAGERLAVDLSDWKVEVTPICGKALEALREFSAFREEDVSVRSLPVGTVRCGFSNVQGMPIQTVASPEAEGVIEVRPEFEEGLRGIEEFDYLILVTHLHRVTKEPLSVVPFLDDETHGVFATRAPARPNKLGLSIVKLLRREGNKLHFSGNDMLDMTPVLDIKPYVPTFDVRETDRVGWYNRRIQKLSETVADGRMEK